ncbi:hypothetical protein BDV36DRAFT_194504 [Aspergillus pseudocaelatus]|uniref:AB hydrolase-1 domain-containing protein n=1 Tax=Aspergillus pseudocaelatus TaxID=1825620 RepID=A0ABQ6X0E6_9EURO|nr:hypothetical protein BDV36DRAFT_194504 [Aspergillus pseudocaelatus]
MSRYGKGLPQEVGRMDSGSTLFGSPTPSIRVPAAFKMSAISAMMGPGTYNSRDILHIINDFRTEMPRPIIGLGHSIGAVQQISLSLIHPRLLTSIILIEPFIHDIEDGAGGSWVAAAARRKDVWPSHSAAAKASCEIWKNWDLRAIGR